MSDIHTTNGAGGVASPYPGAAAGDVLSMVMNVLQGIRPLQSNRQEYHEGSNLTDAGFTSVEMVKVMLGIEAAFDVMIPQEMITPENFTSASAIAVMMAELKQTA